MGRSESKGLSTPFFVDTGTLVAHDSVVTGTEFVWTNGPFSVQAEYLLSSVDRLGGPDVFFQGGYLGLSYFLTGEHRPYDRRRAVTECVLPHASFLRIGTADGSFATGPGAWELATRISHVDVTDQDVDGGVLTNFTAGVDWYLTGYHRIKAEYIRAIGPWSHRQQRHRHLCAAIRYGLLRSRVSRGVRSDVRMIPLCKVCVPNSAKSNRTWRHRGQGGTNAR